MKRLMTITCVALVGFLLADAKSSLAATAAYENQNIESETEPPPPPPGEEEFPFSVGPPTSRPADGPPPRHRGRHRGPGADRRPPHGPKDPLFQQQQIDEMLELLKKHYPQQWKKMKDLQKSNPHAFRRVMRRYARPLMHILHKYREDPEMAELLIQEHKVRMELADLSRQFRDTQDSKKREQLLKGIRQLFEKQFTLQQQRMEREIDNLRRRLEQQAQRLEQRKQHKDKIIEAQILQFKGLLGNEPEMAF